MQKKLTTSALGGRSDSIITTIGNNLLKTAHPDLKSSSKTLKFGCCLPE